MEKDNLQEVIMQEVELEDIEILEEALAPGGGWWCGCGRFREGFLCG